MILTEIKSLRWADLFLSALLDPRALYRQIDRGEPRALLLSFTLPAAVAVIDIITLSLLGRQTPFFYYKVTYGWILLFLWQALAVVLAAALMDTASQFFGHGGAVRRLIILVNFSLFPKVFILPLVYIFHVFNFAPIFFYFFFSMGLFIWSAMVAVQGVSEMHAVSLGRAAVIYLFPAILLWTSVFFMFILLVICGVGFVAG